MSTVPSLSHDELFTMLIFNFQQNAMISLGKLQNPMTGKTQRNLQEAKFSIDMLEMLAEKSKGNRTSEQDHLFKQVLTTLRLNYVDEMNKPEPGQPAPEAASESDKGRHGDDDAVSGKGENAAAKE